MRQWVHKYGKKSRSGIKGILLPQDYANYFNRMIETGAVSDMLIESSTPGTGKTTLIHALAKDLKVELLFIPASINNGIDVLRDRITKFAQSAPMFGDDDMPKVVALDEADGLTTAMQQGLRNVMDEFAGHCNFWLTCNYAHKIIEPLKDSRLQVFSFNMAKYRNEMVPRVIARCVGMLKHEQIPFEDEAVNKFVELGYPNIRNIFNTLDQFSMMYGVVDSRIIEFNTIDSALMDLIISKDYGKIRVFVHEKGYDYSVVYRFMFDNLVPKLSLQCIPAILTLLRQASVDSSLSSADKEIIFADTMVQIIINMRLKDAV